MKVEIFGHNISHTTVEHGGRGFNVLGLFYNRVTRAPCNLSDNNEPITCIPNYSRVKCETICLTICLAEIGSCHRTMIPSKPANLQQKNQGVAVAPHEILVSLCPS